MRLTLVIASLAAGGAERVLSMLANHWAARGDTVALLTLSPVATDFFPVDPQVVRVGLDLIGTSRSTVQAALANVRRIRALRRTVRQQCPDVVVSFGDQSNVLALLATTGLGVPVVISERTDPHRHNPGKIWHGARALAYPLADAIVVQNEHIAGWARERIPRVSCWIISNPVARPRSPQPAPSTDELPHRVVTIGRLSSEKGCDVLLKAFARVAGEFPQWTLRIIGEGPDRAALVEQAARLGLGPRLNFTGALAEPWAGLDEHDLFVLASRYEGEPNALLEAMAAGVPAIASRACGVLEDGVTGLVVPEDDPGALAQAILRLARDRPLARRLARAAREKMTDRSPARILAEWDRVLSSVQRSSSRARQLATTSRTVDRSLDKV